MRLLTALFIALPLALTAACGDDGGTSVPKDGKIADAKVPIDGPSGPDAACFDNPQTNNEIINACTTAEKVYKNSHPPLLNDDGSLPPLP